MKPGLLLGALLGLAAQSAARVGFPRFPSSGPSVSSTASVSSSKPPTGKLFNFTQKIDHFPQDPRYAPHANGTFQQHYGVIDEYYKPGGPIILFLGGENGIGGYVYSPQIYVMLPMVQYLNGLFIALEGRYFGESFPFNSSTTDNLAYLSLEQTLADTDNFARNVKIPIAGLENVTAPSHPWIMYGGSLSGAQVAFAKKAYPNTFYASMGSSAPILAVEGYPDWYAPAQKYGDQDCIATINSLVDNIDSLVATNNTAAVQRLKEVFGLGSLTDIRDFAQTIGFPIGGPNNYTGPSWQEINWQPMIEAATNGMGFFYFCRNVTNLNPPANNTAVDNEFAIYTNGKPWTGLGNYAAYIKATILPNCPSGDYNSADCYGTQHPTYWANTANDDGRSYLYGMCTEYGFYQQASPAGSPSLVMRVLQPSYTQQWCNWAFPKGRHNSISPNGPNLTRWNMYGGLDFSADNVAFIDGTIDPFLDLTYHSNNAPARYWTPGMPELLINGAGHVWDAYSLGGNFTAEPQFVQDAHLFEIRQLERWMQNFPNWKPGTS